MYVYFLFTYLTEIIDSYTLYITHFWIVKHSVCLQIFKTDILINNKYYLFLYKYLFIYNIFMYMC